MAPHIEDRGKALAVGVLNQCPQPQTKWGGPIGAVRGLVVGLRHELCAGFDAHRSRWAELNAVWCRNGTKAWALAGAAFDIVTAGSGYHVLGHVHGLQLGGQVMPGVRTLLGQRVVNTSHRCRRRKRQRQQGEHQQDQKNTHWKIVSGWPINDSA